jgi:hypothetical protein
MIKYRLHNITDFGVEIHDFHTENSLNNYIALFVAPPYWVENLETNKSVYTGFTDINNDTLDKLDNSTLNELGLVRPDNVSRETLHESEIEWIKRHTPTEEEKEPYTKLEKISSFLGILSVIIMATFLLYLFLSSVSFIAEHFSEFTWKVFNIL